MRIDHGLLPGHVLQRTATGASATITGTTDGPCTCPITATVRRGAKPLPGFSGKRIGQAGEGRFTVVLKGLPTGGPYTVELQCGAERAVVREILVGDLWLMAGQSNMEGVGNLCDATEPHPLVRNFAMRREWEIAQDPLHYLAESPDRAHGGGTGQDAKAVVRAKKLAIKGAGVGVHFGKLMHARTKVPQGLIATAHGGTSMAQWNPALKDQGGDSLYGSMRLSLQAVGQPVAGMLWYQGCSDTGPEQVAVYTRKMEELVAAVRQSLGQPKLPWVIVQIGRWTDGGTADPVGWHAIREQQRLLPSRISACDVVSAVDLELDDGIHIAATAYAALAQRMARVAARLVHRDRAERPAIQPRSLRYRDPKPPFGPAIDIEFANVVGGLGSTGLPQGLVVVGQDGRPQGAIYKTVLTGSRATIYLSGNYLPGSRVMYGCGFNPVCNLADARGMGVPAFGPLPVNGQPGISRWFGCWKVTPIRPGEDLAGMACPDPADPSAVERRFNEGNGFVNLHPEWEGRSGHVAFHGHVEASEAMPAEIRFGYDGPIRLWVDGREVHTDLRGTNPAIPDAKRIPFALAPGRHYLSVLMALNGGRAWGFFLRMGRKLAKGQDGDGVALPVPWE